MNVDLLKAHQQRQRHPRRSRDRAPTQGRDSTSLRLYRPSDQSIHLITEESRSRRSGYNENNTHGEIMKQQHPRRGCIIRMEPSWSTCTRHLGWSSQQKAFSFSSSTLGLEIGQLLLLLRDTAAAARRGKHCSFGLCWCRRGQKRHGRGICRKGDELLKCP